MTVIPCCRYYICFPGRCEHKICQTLNFRPATPHSLPYFCFSLDSAPFSRFNHRTSPPPMPAWRNGRRARLKIEFQKSVGSSPTAGIKKLVEKSGSFTTAALSFSAFYAANRDIVRHLRYALSICPAYAHFMPPAYAHFFWGSRRKNCTGSPLIQYIPVMNPSSRMNFPSVPDKQLAPRHSELNRLADSSFPACS